MPETIVNTTLDGNPIITQPTSAPESKTFSEDYVKALREEAKAHRIAAKAREKQLKEIIGLKDDEELDDSKITGYKAAQQKQLTDVLTKANERLLQAEIKGLAGYDAKLVARLLDRSKVIIADDGTITGLTEAAEALAVEFPQVKLVQMQTNTTGNPAQAKSLGELDQLKADYAAAVKANNLPEQINLKNKIFVLEHK